MVKGFIFDMDGILFDTENLMMEAIRAVSRRHGENDNVEAFFPATCGTTFLAAKALYKKFYGEDYPFEERRAEARRWMNDYIKTNGIALKSGAKELLSYLRENGYKIALATSASRASAEGNLKAAGFTEYFDASVCGDEITKSKPDPEIFLKAAEKLGVPAYCCFAAEDSYLGVESAANAGMMVFMVPDMNPPREKEKALAYKICDSLFDVMECL